MKHMINGTPLFKTVFGSKLYGTSTPESDTDWKVVYIPSVNDLLLGRSLHNKKESTAGVSQKCGADDVEIEYIPLHIFVKDFYGGQSYAVEIAFAALDPLEIEHVFYKYLDQPEYFKNFCTELVSKFLTSNVKAMTGYAMHQAQVYSVKGSRLASLEKLVRIFEEGVKQLGPNVKIRELFSTVERYKDAYLFNTEIAGEHGSQEMLPAICCIGKYFTANISIEDALSRAMIMVTKYGERAKAAKQAEGLDWKAISHAVRVTDQAIQILSTGKLTFPFVAVSAKYLLEVKRGEHSWDSVEEVLSKMIESIDAEKQKSKLQPQSKELEEALNEWFLEKLKLIYFSHLVEKNNNEGNLV